MTCPAALENQRLRDALRRIAEAEVVWMTIGRGRRIAFHLIEDTSAVAADALEKAGEDAR